MTVRPWRNSPITTRLRYYFVPEGTPMLPYANHWAHPSWNDKGITYSTGLGYIQTDNLKVPNRPPAVRYEAHACGAQRLWEEGQVLGEDLPLPWLFGHPSCCLPGDLFGEELDGGAVLAGSLTETFLPAADPLGGSAVAEGELVETVELVEDLAGAAVAEGELPEELSPVEESLGGSAVAEGELVETVELVEDLAGAAVAEGELPEELEEAGGGILTDCSGSYEMPATLYWSTADCCGGFADEPMTWTPGGWEGTDAWLTTPLSCSGNMVHFGLRCTMSGWQVGQFVDGVLVGTGTISSESYSPFLAGGMGAFTAPSCSFTASFVISETT